MPKMVTVAEARLLEQEAKNQMTAAMLAFAAAQDALTTARRAVHQTSGQLIEALKREQANTVARDRREAKTLAAKHGFEIETENFPDGPVYWVWAPDGLYAPEGEEVEGKVADPYCGCRSCIAWSEVVEIARVYAAAAQAAKA